MFVDDFVDFRHETNCFFKGNHNAVVVGDVFLRQFPSTAVFEPFLTDLVATDVKVPDGLRHTGKAGGLRFVEPDGLAGVADLFDFVLGVVDEARDEVFQFGRLQEMEGDEFAAEPGQGAEELQTRRQRQSREINL